MRLEDTTYSKQVGLWTATLILGLGFGFGQCAWGQSAQYSRKAPAKANVKTEKQSDVQAKDKSDKLDITDLEQKYWAPKDTDFTVVQNRAYTKEGKIFINGMVGPVVNETFSSGQNFGLIGNYYFSERHGVQVSYINSMLSNSKATESFKSLSSGGVLPDYNTPTNFVGVSYNWVPVYAKMSVLGKKIIYFDMQFSPGIGLASFEQRYDADPTGGIDERTVSKSAVAFSLDVTQYYFFTPHLAVRADLHNRWYNQDLLVYNSNPGKAVAKSELNNTTMFMLGITYFFSPRRNK